MGFWRPSCGHHLAHGLQSEHQAGAAARARLPIPLRRWSISNCR